MSIDLSVVGKSAPVDVREYSWKDTALYALSVGAGTEDLSYLLDPTPAVLPTFGVIPAFDPVFSLLRDTGGDLVNLLHAGQRTELLAPFPARGTMETRATVRGIYDMKIGAAVIVDTVTAVDGVDVAATSWNLLMRGEGGFGGARPPARLRVKPPAGVDPAVRVEVPTARTQALLYRLNGDINPIHARPEVAKEAGFDRPILHGLCTYGIAARVVLSALAGGDPARFGSYEALFSKVVFPGDTLVVEAWPLEPGQAAVTVTVKETGEKAIATSLFTYAP